MSDRLLHEDLAFQEKMLQEVSRTFALTIPLLPRPLRKSVGVAYLLCRIADTMEDSDTLTVEEKLHFSRQFADSILEEKKARAFGGAVTPKLGGSTLTAERNLVFESYRATRITLSLSEQEQQALKRCVQVMCAGMEKYQEGMFISGLKDMDSLDDYCYYVAGVVGEMLTELFCVYSPKIAEHYSELYKLAVPFGRGLQMVNILKDIWDDKQRNACWLPRKEFAEAGFDLDTLSPAMPPNSQFEAGLEKCIAHAHGFLREALDYTLLIPRSEANIREFCILPVYLALKTLNNINRNRGFRSGEEVKITRRDVQRSVIATKLSAQSNFATRTIFAMLAKNLPR